MKWTLLNLEILLKYLKKMWRLGGPEVYQGESKVEERMEISDDPQTLSPSRIQGSNVLYLSFHIVCTRYQLHPTQVLKCKRKTLTKTQ